MLKNVIFWNQTVTWVDECNYLEVTVSSCKYFRTVCEDKKRKFYEATNSIIMSGLASVECAVYLLKVHCLPILMYGAGVWSCTEEIIWQLGMF